ncbi:hypothetical protein T06_152 [Trichinella sp. T6]|nr:hypothetical protein T06_152 [Trichinella sp. T6]
MNMEQSNSENRLNMITSSAEYLWCSFCSGQRDKSCSHHFVLNLASQTSLNRTVFAATFPSCPSVISLSQSSRESSFRVALMSTYWCLLLSVRFQCDMTKISNCGLRHPMKLVPFATRVRMDVMAFPSLCLSQIVSFINTSDAEDEDRIKSYSVCSDVSQLS